MRLVSWNCNMALPRKWAALRALKPDVAVIQECASPDRLGAHLDGLASDRCLWTGDNPNKGLGVFAFGDVGLEPWPVSMAGADYFLPVRLTGPVEASLLAVWATWRRTDKLKAQLGPVHRALDRLDGFFDAAPALVAGDFNSNVGWDRPGKRRNFADLAARFGELGLTSTYHACRGLDLGREPEPTIYWRDRTADGPSYHIDYVFAPTRIPVSAYRLTVGQHADWVATGLSDHVPLVFDIDDDALRAAACKLEAAA